MQLLQRGAGGASVASIVNASAIAKIQLYHNLFLPHISFILVSAATNGDPRIGNRAVPESHTAQTLCRMLPHNIAVAVQQCEVATIIILHYKYHSSRN